MIQAFLFDFNATLIHSAPWMALEIHELPRQAFAYLAAQGYIAPLETAQLAQAAAIFRAERRKADRTRIETNHIDNLRTMVEALDLTEQIPLRLIEETVAALQRRCVSTVKLIDGAANMLRQLQAQGYRLAIISNAAYGPFLLWSLENLGVRCFFEAIIVSADIGLRKPDPNIFRLTLERMALASAETVYVGDDFERDIVGAKQAGVQAIWYRPQGSRAREMKDESLPDAIVTHLSQIPALGDCL